MADVKVEEPKRRMKAEHVSYIAIALALLSGGTVSGLNMSSNGNVITQLEKNNVVISKELKDLRDASIETKDAVKGFEKAFAANDERFKSMEMDNKGLRAELNDVKIQLGILMSRSK